MILIIFYELKVMLFEVFMEIKGKWKIISKSEFFKKILFRIYHII